jgi:hypothetical protein
MKKANALPYAGVFTRLNSLSPRLLKQTARSLYFALVF